MRKNVLLATIIISSFFSDSLLASRNRLTMEDDSPPSRKGPVKGNKKGGKSQSDEEAQKMVQAEQRAVVDKLKTEAQDLARQNQEAQRALAEVQSQMEEDQETLLAMLQKKNQSKQELEAAEATKAKLEEEQSALKEMAAEEQAKLAELAKRKAEIDRQIQEGEALLEQRMNGSSGSEDNEQFQRMRAELEAEWQQRLAQQVAETKRIQEESEAANLAALKEQLDPMKQAQGQPDAGENSNNNGANSNSNNEKKDEVAGAAQAPAAGDGNPVSNDGKKAVGAVDSKSQAVDSSGQDNKGKADAADVNASKGSKQDPVDEDNYVPVKKRGWGGTLLNGASALVSVAYDGAGAILNVANDGAAVLYSRTGAILSGASEVLGEASSIGRNFVINEATRLNKTREERFEKGSCPNISVTELLKRIKDVWFEGRSEEELRNLTCADFFCCLKPWQFENEDGPYHYFVGRVTAGHVRVTHKNTAAEEKTVNQLPTDEQNKKRLTKLVLALQSRDPDTQLGKLSAVFNQDEAGKPYEYLLKIIPLLKDGVNTVLWIDQKYTCRPDHNRHHYSQITLRLVGYEPLKYDQSGKPISGGESYHFSIYGYRVRSELTVENIPEKYLKISRTPFLAAGTK